MATRKDVLMTQVVSALAQGCGTAQLTDDASSWFYDRYYNWIDTPKKDPRANGTSPMEVWAQYGPDFLGKFREIGQKAAAGGDPVSADTLSADALTVETDSDCPWCPINA